MNETALIQYITETFDNIHIATADGNSFFFVGPYGESHKFPFATLVTNDLYDQVSDLNRPEVYRLNIGVSKQTYQSLFGDKKSDSGDEDDADSYDFTALDQIMSHPVYGKMYWVCVLTPGDATWLTVQGLLAEAYEMDVRKQVKKRPLDEA